MAGYAGVPPSAALETGVPPLNRLRFRMAAGVALGLVALFAVFGVLMRWAIQLSTDAVLRERLVVARQTAAAIDDLLGVSRHQLEALASQVAWEGEELRPARAQTSLLALQHVTGTFDSLGVVGLDGEVLWASKAPEDRSSWQKAALQVIATRASAFSQGEGPQEHPPIALAAAPLRSPRGQIAGALVGALHLAHMGVEIVPLPKGGEGLKVEVADVAGRILAASGAREGPYIAYDHLALLGHAVRGGYEATAVHEVGGGHVVAYVPFEHIAGGVFVEEQNDVALAVPRSFQRVGLFVGSTALLLFSLAAWWHASRLTWPLEQLTGAARAMAQGVFDQPVPEKRQDELGLLARSFEEMRLQLKASLEERQRWEHELEGQVAARTQEVRLLLGKVMSAQEEERQRVSRELHDGAAQHLATLLVLMDGLLTNGERGDDRLLAQAGEQARNALQEIRRLVLDLRPAALDDLGLVPALRWYAESRLLPLGIPLSFVVEGRERRLDPALETALFRIGQEAMTNVVKHAAARRVSITLTFGEETLSITVEDDGQGFDPAGDPGRGVGLDGMRERAALVGGALTVRSAPGQGTQVTAMVSAWPLGPPASAAGVPDG